MRNLRELNVNEGGKPVRHPSPSDAEIKALEKQLRSSLPLDYVELLRFANGGHPEADTFVPQGHDPRNTWAVNRFYSLGPDRSTKGSLWGALEDWRAILGARALPIANDGGGNQIFLSFDHTPPAVMLCIHDQNYKIVKVANSFAQFIDGLFRDPEDV